MHIIDYFKTCDAAPLIAKIEAADWSAAKFLANLLKENTFEQTLGEGGSLFLLMNGDALISFATLTRKDCIEDDSLSPWLGFFYTFPEYRGHRYGGLILAHAEKEARTHSCEKLYLATDSIGLYEKYGYTYTENRIDVWGEDSRIYFKPLLPEK